MKGYLVLEDGSYYEGTLFGHISSEIGEIVFNTSMTGYEEIVTDPSYSGQVVVMTYPLIGNYGVNEEDNQHEKSFVKGLVVRECNEHYSHWRGKKNLNDYLKEQKITGIKDIDTRALTKKIRNLGTMSAQIIQYEDNIEKCAQSLKVHKLDNYIESVTAKEAYVIPVENSQYKVAVMDFGVKKNILSSLIDSSVELKVFPGTANYKEIMTYKPDALLLSNGPGDPSQMGNTVEEIKKFIGQLPILGICLGHQLLSIALGGKTKKLKYGHRGGNHPVKDIKKDRIFITAQNHGYVVEKESLDLEAIDITHYSVNDMSIEGIEHKKYMIKSVQYHPEASPGPQDSDYIFKEFINMIEGFKNEKYEENSYEEK